MSATPPSEAKLSLDELPEDERLEKASRNDSRMLKNRESAKRSREVAREHVNRLERNVTALSQESQMLMRRLNLAEAENTHLRQAQWMNHSVAITARQRGGEPAALCPSLQRIPSPVLLFLSTAARLLPAQDTPTPVNAQSPETQGLSSVELFQRSLRRRRTRLPTRTRLRHSSPRFLPRAR